MSEGGQQTRIGRPRGFDTDEAVERAMRVFWELGYEGASLSDLTTTMGINRTSLYAAFGSKYGLFREAVKRYAEGPGGYVGRALAEPTAERVARAFLAGSVETTTTPGCPAGCLSVQGSLAPGSAAHARDLLTSWREETVSALRERFQRALDEGDLPTSADPALLARYLMTVSNGIAVQAAAGTPGDDLRQVAEAALRGWLPAP